MGWYPEGRRGSQLPTRFHGMLIRAGSSTKRCRELVTLVGMVESRERLSWSFEEDQKIVRGVHRRRNQQPYMNWTQIAKELPGRTPSSARSRYC
eukprot:2596191-Prymnesium_polylepis.1